MSNVHAKVYSRWEAIKIGWQLIWFASGTKKVGIVMDEVKKNGARNA